jgi:hypothetical protein
MLVNDRTLLQQMEKVVQEISVKLEIEVVAKLV